MYRSLCWSIPIVTLAVSLMAGDYVHIGKVQWNGQPIPGAIVRAASDGREVLTSTDEHGMYRITGLPPGKWNFRIRMFGFEAIERTVDVDSAGSRLDWTLELGNAAPAAPAAQSTSQRRPNQSADAEAAAAMLNSAKEEIAPAALPSGTANSSEAFILNGSMHLGLQPADSGPAATNGGLTANRMRVTVGIALRDSTFDARPYSLTGETVRKPGYDQETLTVNLSGGLGKRTRKKRPLLTLGYQHGLGDNPFSAVATVPSLLERKGDFSQSIAAGAVRIFDPLTVQPFAGNQIPQSRIRAASLGLLDFFPTPNQSGKVQNYQLTSQTPSTTDVGRVNIDVNLSSKHTFGFSQTYNRTAFQNLQVFGYRDRVKNTGYTSTLSWTTTLAPNVYLSSYGTMERTTAETTPFLAFGKNVAAQLGIQGTSQDPENYGPPNLSFTNFGPLTDASFSRRRDTRLELGATAYQAVHAHNLKYGAEFARDWLGLRTDENGRGTYFLSGLATSAFDSSGNPVAGTGFDLADFLLGLPQSGSVRYGASDNGLRGVTYGSFVTDDWAVSANLSLSIGFRYEYFSPYTEKRDQLSNLDVASNFTDVALVLAGQRGAYSGNFPRSLIDPARHGFAPRLGFNWQPIKNVPLTVRAGYGIYYDGSVYEPIAERLASQPPFANTGTLTTSLAEPLTIENGFLSAAPGSSDSIRNTYAAARKYQLGYAQIWNFVLSQDLPGAIHLEEGYLGTKGTHLDIQRLPNRALPGSPLDSEQRRLIPYADAFLYESSQGDSTFHAGQIQISRRMRGGMLANVLYTFGRMIDDVSTYGGGLGVVAQNDDNLRAERGLSSQDIRHNVNTTFAVVSPFGRQGSWFQTGPAGTVLRGWTLQGGVIYTSGHWLTARTLGNLSDAGGSGSIGNARADSTGLPVHGSNGFFNLAAFSLPAPGQFGTAGRNTIPTPGALTINASFGRTFRLDDKHRLELRAESNNLANAVSITGFGTTVNASNYGLAASAAKMRSLLLRARLRF